MKETAAAQAQLESSTHQKNLMMDELQFLLIIFGSTFIAVIALFIFELTS